MDFRVEPEVCLVDQPVEVRVTAILDRPLRPGDRIAFAPPESWSSQPFCVTLTMDFNVCFEEPFVSDAVYYLRVGQRKQVGNYPVFAWSSPIWVTRRSGGGQTND